MKKLTTLLMALMMMSTALWAEETITVSANSSDISEGLDLKVVAKLFAEAKNLEEFETMLNNPDSAFCNLDLNGDGQVDYLRVVETGEGNKRLIVLQAILAKDIFQDVASIYVEKDSSTNQVSVQVIGDEYVYGANYIIEPVYVYRPVIYDWFWSPAWYAWVSPWYWGYYPHWWYYHSCWSHDWYWHHCYAWHHHHHWCTFHHGHHPHHGYHDLYHRVSRREYATAHPSHSFSHRNAGMTNAREIRSTTSVRGSQRTAPSRQPGSVSSRTFDSRNTVSTRSVNTNARPVSTSTRSTATTGPSRTTSTTRTTSSATSGRPTSVTTTRSTSSSSTRSTATSGPSRSTSSTSSYRPSSTTSTKTSSSTRSTSTYSPSRSSSSSSSSYSGSRSSGSSTRSSGGFSGGSSSRGGGGGFSGGGSRGGGGGGSRGGGGSVRR